MLLIVSKAAFAAEAALESLETDLALIFDPIRSSDFQTMAAARQSVYCCMSETHELAKLEQIRLHHCIDVPAILPTALSGIRQLLNVGLMRRNIKFTTVIETDSQEFIHNYLLSEQVISFQIPIGMPQEMVEGRPVNGMVARPIDITDVPEGTLHIGHLRGRVLPVAAAKFLDSIVAALGSRCGRLRLGPHLSDINPYTQLLCCLRIVCCLASLTVAPSVHCHQMACLSCRSSRPSCYRSPWRYLIVS